MESEITEIDKAKHVGHLAAAYVREQYIHQAHTIISWSLSHLDHYDQAVNATHEQTAELQRLALTPEERACVDEVTHTATLNDELFRNEVIPAIQRNQPSQKQALNEKLETYVNQVVRLKEGAYDYLTKPFDPEKGLVARAIHCEGLRKDKRFVAVNCGAIPENLIESELFGHKKGSFTGAIADKRGLFEEAEGGTLFLDEVGELPFPLQVKLTRVLQERAVRRVGEAEERPVDVRILAATNVDLKEAVKEGKFREDLFYRLNIFPIRLPPLREKREDIPLLAALFLERHGRQQKSSVTGFTPEALSALMRYDWPGNVRELQNAIERALAVSDGPRIGVEALPEEMPEAGGTLRVNSAAGSLTYHEAVQLTVDRASRDYLVALMREFKGNVTKAAERAGIERESLHRLLKRYGMRSEMYKEKDSAPQK